MSTTSGSTKGDAFMFVNSEIDDQSKFEEKHHEYMNDF